MMACAPLLTLRRLLGRDEGSATIEFALIGPLFLLLMMGIFQFSIVMQAYSALNSAAADVQRQVVTQGQTGNKLSTSQMRDTAISIATAAPYFINPDKLTVVRVDPVSTSRVSGASEYTLTMTYQAPVVVWITPLTFSTTYTRSIFLKAST